MRGVWSTPDVVPVCVVNERPHTAATHEVEAEVQQAVVRLERRDIGQAVGETPSLRCESEGEG